MSTTSQTTMTTTVSVSDLYIILNQIAALDPTRFQAFLDSITLTADQTDLLRQIANRFAVVYPSPESTPSNSATSTSNSPWKALHRCNNLVLPEVYLSILSSGPEHFVNSYSTATIHDGCISATKTSQQRSIQRLRELFIALALYDSVRSHFPRFSGNRLSDRMKDEMISLLPGVDVVEQYRMGKNLDHLCKCFAVGCVFYLAEYLSKDFLCKKFTASGTYHDDAIRYLNTLDLVQLAEENGANSFASKVRVLSVVYLQTRTSQ